MASNFINYLFIFIISIKSYFLSTRFQIVKMAAHFALFEHAAGFALFKVMFEIPILFMIKRSLCVCLIWSDT